MSSRKLIGIGLVVALVFIGIFMFVQPATRGMETTQRQDVVLQAFSAGENPVAQKGAVDPADVVKNAPVEAAAVDLQNLAPYDSKGQSQYDRWLRGEIDMSNESLLTRDEIEVLQARALKLPASRAIGKVDLTGSSPDMLAPGAGLGFDSLDVDECCGSGANVPPDPEMSAGPDHLIAVVNVAFEIYDKSGATLVLPTTLSSFFAPLGGTNCTDGGPFDPNTLYDEEADRFMIAADGDGNAYCVGVSQTSDPTGAWWLYEFPTNVGGNFFDYPHAGIGRDAIYMGANMFGASYVEARIWALDKNAMYAGAPTTFVSRTTGDDDTPQPVNLHGFAQGTWPTSGPHYILTSRDFNGQTYALHSWDDPFGADVFTTEAVFDLPAVHGVAVDFPVDSLQPAPGQPILANDFRPLDFEYRNGMGYTAMTVSCNPGSGTVNCIQWAVVDLAGAALVDTGVHASDGQYLYFPDVAANACGDMAVGFTVSDSTSLFPSVAVTGREATDPPGQVLVGFIAKVGEEAYSAFDGFPYRWGDYTGMTIDPDGQTFWYLGEYSKDVASTSANWGDYIQSSIYPGCDPGLTPLISLEKTVGTVDGVCADTNFIEVLPGTDVYYCYTVTNTGEATLNLHDLEDSELGVLLDDFALALAPGDVVEVTTTAVTIDVDTMNTAVWTAFNNDAEAASASSSSAATVNVQEPPHEGLVCNGPTVGFEEGIFPVGWSITTAADPGGEWVISTDNSSSFWNPGAAPEGVFYASANDDGAGSGSDGSADYLYTNILDLSGIYGASLNFQYHYNGAFSHAAGGVQVSPDGGATWDAEIIMPTGDLWQSYMLDLSAYVGNNNVQVRFHSDDGGFWAAGYAVDDILLECQTELPPIIEVDPTWLGSVQPPDTQVVAAMDIGNVGGADLDWYVEEADAVPASINGDVGRVSTAAASVPNELLANAYAPDPSAILLSEGFEGGVIPPIDWLHVNTNPSFTWQLHDFDPFAGAYATEVLYDPALVPQDEWLLSPEMTLSDGTLSFWSNGSVYWCRDTFDNCDLDIWIVVGAPGGGDDVYVGRADGDWTDSFVWSQSTFNLSGLLPGGPVRIGFQYTGVDGAQITLDEIVLDGTEGEPTGCAAPLDLPWVSVTPDNGVVTPLDTQTVDVTFDSTGLAPGIYQGMLCVHSNDPATPLVEVMLEMTVEEAASSGMVYLSSNSRGMAGDVEYKDDDIIAYDILSGDWSMYFDGSDVGLKEGDVDAMHIMDDGSILMSFEQRVRIPGFGRVDDSDIVKFIPTSLGDDTAGSFEWFFDGSDVGLRKGGEDVDAIAFTPDGRLVVSTLATGKVPMTGGGRMQVGDEQLIALNNAVFGHDTEGDWEMYFDGRDVELRPEDIWGAWIDAATGDIYLSLQDAFSLPGVSGDGLDIFACHPLSLGDDTACDYGPGLFFDGSAAGFGGDIIDAFFID